MSSFTLNHSSVSVVNFKQGTTNTAVKQVIFKAKDSRGCALWCAPYTFYLPQVNSGCIKSITLYRKSTEEPTVYTGTTTAVSSSGTTSYTVNGTTYGGTPYYNTYYNDKVYISASPADVTYSTWYNGSETITTPVASNPTLTTTGDATSPNITITNPNNFSVDYTLYYGATSTDTPVKTGTLNKQVSATISNLEDGVTYRCIFSKIWYRNKTTYSVSIGKDPNNGTSGTTSSSPWTISGNNHFIITGSSSTTTETSTKTGEATKQPVVRNTYAVTWDTPAYCTAYTSTSDTATSGGGSGTKYSWGSEIIYAATLNNNDNDYYYTPDSSWGLISGRSYKISNHLIKSATRLNKATAIANKYNYSVGSSLSNATVNWYSNSGYSTALGKVQTGSTIYLKVNPNAHYQTTVSSTRYYNGNLYKTSVTFNSTNFTLSPNKSTPDSSSSATYKSFPTISAISYQPSSTNSNCSVSWTKATYGSNSTGTITPSSYYYSSSASVTKAVNDTNFTISDANATAADKTTVSCSPITYTITPTPETGGTITWSSSTLKKGTTESSKLTLTPSAGFRLRSGITSGNTISWSSFSFSPTSSTNGTSTGTATYSLNAFEAIPYTLTISSLPTGCSSVTVQRSSVGTAGSDAGASTGNLSNNSTIYYGDKLSVSATPSATYYQLSYSSSITVDGNETVSVSASYKSYSLTIKVPANCNSVQYRFKKQGGSWTLYSALTSTQTVSIEYGAEVQIGANPADGYTANYPYSNPYSFTMPASSQSFEPVMSVAAYTLNVKVTGQITGLYLEIRRGNLSVGIAPDVVKTVTSTSSYSIYKGDKIFISNVTASTGYHVVQDSYATETTVDGSGLIIEPLSALNTYIFTITKGTGISTIYYKANGASSYSSSTNTTTNVIVNHGSTIYVYGATTTGSSYLPGAYTSSSPYSKLITGAGSVTISANSIAAPVLAREGNDYKTQFKVTNNNPYAMTFYYGTSAGATSYNTTIAANTSAYVDSSVSEGNTVYGKFYYSGTTATSSNASLALTAINYSTSSTATTTGSQVTIEVASSSGSVSGIEVGYGASSTWSTTITSNATSSGWSKSFTSPSTSATYFHYRKKGYATKYNVFNYTMSKLTAPTLNFYTELGTLRVYNKSGITADVYHSLNSTYGSGILIKSSLANNGYYDHTRPIRGNTNFYYLKPNSNSCRFNSDKASYNVPGSSVSTSASLYYYNASKDEETLIGTMSSTIPTTVKDIGVYPHFELYELLFRIKYSPTSASASVSVSGGQVMWLDSGNGIYDFWIESPGEEITITITIGSENRYIRVSGTKDGWPD